MICHTSAPRRLFIDFDGTIAHLDVGNTMFTTFIPAELVENGWHRDLIDSWKEGRITSEECLTEECRQASFNRDKLDALLDRMPLTAGFVELAAYCRREGIPITILSDGLDYYIEYLLGKYGISDIEYFSNHLFFENGGAGVSFPYARNGCGRCGNCKRWHIERLRRDGEQVIYVGDGYSDRFAVRSADIIFARRDLAAYCDREGIDYIPYDNFHRILDCLKNGDEKLERDIPAGRPAGEH